MIPGVPPAMRVGVTGASLWDAGGGDSGRGSDEAPGSNGAGLSLIAAREPERPERFPPGTWRKMSRLARLVARAAEPLVHGPEDALIVGVSGGEFASSVAFLRSYYLRGAALASPLAFQNSVHNAPAAHLSIDLGLTGWSETLLAGEATFWRTLERGMSRVLASGAPVIVVIAEELSPEVRDGMKAADVQGTWLEGAAAFRLEPLGTAVGLSWWDRPQRGAGAAEIRAAATEGDAAGAERGGAAIRVHGGPFREAARLFGLIAAGYGTLDSPPHLPQPAWLEVC